MPNFFQRIPSWLASLLAKDRDDSELVKKREGLVLRVYKDSLGKLTAGYGHLLRPGEDKLSITQALADKWLDEDLTAASNAATAQCARLPFSTEEFRETLISVNFQLGTSWASKFPKTWSLMTQGKYDEAAWEAEDSTWAKQTPVRVRDLQRALWRLGCQYEVYVAAQS